jgi:hypothetical protein
LNVSSALFFLIPSHIMNPHDIIIPSSSSSQSQSHQEEEEDDNDNEIMSIPYSSLFLPPQSECLTIQDDEDDAGLVQSFLPFAYNRAEAICMAKNIRSTWASALSPMKDDPPTATATTTSTMEANTVKRPRPSSSSISSSDNDEDHVLQNEMESTPTAAEQQESIVPS